MEAKGKGQGQCGAGGRGITIAEWFLGLEFTAELCLTGAPFCLSVDTKHMRQAYDQGSQCPLNNKHNLLCSVRAKAFSIPYLTCTHRPEPSFSLLT